MNPSDRWLHVDEVLAAYHQGAIESRAAGLEWKEAMAEVKAAVEAAGATEQMTQPLLRLDDAANARSSDASQGGYDVGYGDGWHVGLLVAMRLAAAAAGAQVPRPSKALAFMLGLPEPDDEEPGHRPGSRDEDHR